MRGLKMVSIVGLAALLAGVVAVAERTPQGRQGRGGQTGAQVAPDQECPPGTTLVRVGRCQAPDKPAPSILDYRPRSTVVAEEHLVPKAKFPVVDVHTHVTESAGNMPQMIQEMDALNLRVLINLSGGSGASLEQKVEAIRTSAYKDRFRVFANVNWNGAGTPEWRDREVAALRQAVADGAVGIGEISKALGLYNTKADGSRLQIDDPDLDPIWDRLPRSTCRCSSTPPTRRSSSSRSTPQRAVARAVALRQPPLSAGSLSVVRGADGRARPTCSRGTRRPRSSPRTWPGMPTTSAGRAVLDEMPNVYTEVGAVLYDIGRQPRAAHDFFVKYQDRLLFGKDSFQPGNTRTIGGCSRPPTILRLLPRLPRVLEALRHRLPDTVLKKVYFQNALKITPGLPQTGW